MLGEWTERESDGTTASSKLLRLAISVWDVQPEDSASFMGICFGGIFRRVDEWDGQADAFY